MPRITRENPQFSPFALAIGLMLGAPGLSASNATDVATNPVFESSFLRGLGQDIDLSRYSEAGVIVPGDYQLDITLNGKERLRQSVRVVADEAGQAQHFCFSSGDVQRWGARLDQLPDQEEVARLLASNCIEPQALIPGATFSMDVADLSGELSIPQAYAGRVRRGYVDPSEWNEGITAATLGYHANAFHNERDGTGGSTDYNVNLNAGFNVAGWRLRHNGNYIDSSEAKGEYQAQNSYAQTDVDALQAQLTLGEYFTPGGDLDSVPFTGVQLASEDSMLPESQRGFAPIVHGTAETNAKVSIRQGGNLVYETSVAPGAFVIDDLYSTSYGGDLEVTVTEADGREKSFTVPYSAVVQMLRPGTSRFNLAAGRYRNDSLEDAPSFVQGTYRRGISNNLTLYGGGILAEDYASTVVGGAVGTPVGAVALDATLSRANNLPGEDDQVGGRSYRISYSKLVESTATNFSLAAYRFSSEGYLSFGDFALLREGDSFDTLHERNRFQVSISQPMGEAGDFNFTGLARNYWDGRPSSTTFQLGYNKSFSWGSMGLSASRNEQEEDEHNTYMLTASIPLGSGPHRSMLSTTATFDNDDSSTLRTNLSGSTGQYNETSYGLYASRSTHDGEASQTYGGNLNHRNSSTQLGASYSQGEDYRQYSASATGTVVAYSDGLVFSPERGETIALVVAEEAAGAALSNGGGNRLDGDGEAVRSGLSAYRRNSVGIDPGGLPMDVELTSTSQSVVPRRGAVVRVDFAAETGRPLLLHVQGEDLPFGADVVDAEGEHVALVGQGGLIFLRGEHQGLRAVWGQESNQSCQLRFTMPEGESDTPYQQIEAQCVKG